MSNDTVKAVRAAMPLEVREVQYNDPVLSISGDGWWLTLMCPWLIRGRNGQYSWEVDEVEDKVWDLIGHSIVSVSFDSGVEVDPTFEFDGEISLEICADSDWEPWTMQVPGLVVIGRKKGG